jgi:hypothetical protein
MGRKQQIQPFKTISNGDLSLASTTGIETTVAQTDVVQYDVEWTGASLTSGDISIEATLDGVVWFTLDFGSTVSLAGASGNHQLIIKQVSFIKTRPVFTRTNPSASGTLNVTVFATTVGA